MIETPLEVDSVALLLMPHFHSHTLTAITSVLRLTNREFGRTIFDWALVSQTGGAISASDELSFDTVAINQVKLDFKFICVLAAYRPLVGIGAPLRRWLKQQHRRKSYLIGVESGALVLAEVGLLTNHATALHYEDEGTFRERWPDRPTFNGLYNFDETVATTAGAAATLDFALAFVEKRCDPVVADQVARVLRHRRRDALGRPLAPAREAAWPAHILEQSRKIMLQHLDNPIPISALCQQLDIGERRLRRLFDKALSVSPSRYYLGLRLTEARFMLLGTELTVTEVSAACGFASASAFARAYKAHFGFPPSQHRTPYMGLLPSPFWPRSTRESNG